jgi:hypothetical protein
MLHLISATGADQKIRLVVVPTVTSEGSVCLKKAKTMLLQSRDIRKTDTIKSISDIRCQEAHADRAYRNGDLNALIKRIANKAFQFGLNSGRREKRTKKRARLGKLDAIT